jgi:hypothetical protein
LIEEDPVMMNEEVLSTADDFLALRERFVCESTGAQFKTQMVGGFRQDEVKDFIVQMKEDYRTLEQRMKGEMNDLVISKMKMEQELEGREDQQIKLDKAQSDLHTYVSECREKDSEIEQLQEQICHLSDQRDEMKGLIGEAGQEISRLMDVAASIEEERNIVKMKLAEIEKDNMFSDVLEQQIVLEKQKNISLEELLAEKETEMQVLKQEKARALSNEITGFKEEVFSIYKKIENIAGEQAKINDEIQLKLDGQITANSELLQQLEGQTNINNELLQQLDDERLRAVKAEADQASYIKCICELKESLFRERAHLETQLSQIADRRDDVNGSLVSLQEIL